jgi:hypothetical protein
VVLKDVKDIDCENMDWINLARDRDQCGVFFFGHDRGNTCYRNGEELLAQSSDS